MSAEKISELDKRLSIQEATVIRVLESVEKLTNSTEKLTESVTRMTGNLSHNTEETKELRREVKDLGKHVQKLQTEVSVIKQSTKWQDWAGRAIVVAMVGAVFFAMNQMS